MHVHVYEITLGRGGGMGWGGGVGREQGRGPYVLFWVPLTLLRPVGQ